MTRTLIALTAMMMLSACRPAPGLTDTRPLGLAVGLYPVASASLDLPYPPPLDEVAALGARSILLPVPWAQTDVTDTRLRRTARTPKDDDVSSVAGRARALGMSVALMPMIEIEEGPPTDWRGRIEPVDREAWWTSYRTMVLHYAELADDIGASILVIGSELTSMSGERDGPDWRRLARAVRARFGGRLAFVVNHDALGRTGPAAYADILGVSAYFPLTRSDAPTREELRDSWRSILDRLRRVKTRVGRPLVLFEVGYPSVDGGAALPWDYRASGPVDLEEQRAAYAASVDALIEDDVVDGAFYWIWAGPGGRFDRTYTPRDKPAARELKRLFRTAR